MTIEPRFLTVSEVMEIHDQEIVAAGIKDKMDNLSEKNLLPIQLLSCIFVL